MKTILISGASGFIATNFMRHYAQKYNFVKLSHRKQDGYVTLEELASNRDLLQSIDVVINLAGANIGAKRWTQARKDELLDSRIKTTHRLTKIFNQAGAKVHFISASAVGVYLPDLDNDEHTLINYEEYANFSQLLTRQWESVAFFYKGDLTITRFGVVLGGSGGAFPKMLRPFLFFMGGALGNGMQYFPWISLIDLLGALDYIIDTNQTGIYNLVAPQIISNNELSKLIAVIWHRPCIFRMPKFLIWLFFGQMGQELFLNSLKVNPNKLSDGKFSYQYPDIRSCLTAIKAGLF